MAEDSRKMRVKELVVRDVITVEPGDSLSEAVSLMAEHRVSAMPVVDSRNRCKGILSSTDLVQFFREFMEGREGRVGQSVENDAAGTTSNDGQRVSAPLASSKVSEHMTGDVMTVGLEDSALKAAREMVRSRVHRLAVVDSNNRVVGILSTLDLLEALSGEE